VRAFDLSRCVVGICATASILGCGGSQPPIGAPGAFAQSRVIATLANNVNYKVLYSFLGEPDAEKPLAGLLAGKNGEYYGTSAAGGSTDRGAVYEITAAGKEKVLYSFRRDRDGKQPQSTLIMDQEGALYGTTVMGGGACDIGGCGTVFKLRPGKQGWTESVLYAFQGRSRNDGEYPYGGLVMIKSGALLGTTNIGGERDGGIVYELKPSGSTYTEKVVCSFDYGLNPTAALVSDSSGNLYGTTTDGGRYGRGTVFKLTPSGSTYTFSTIYNFTGRRAGKYPSAGLLPAPNGVFYGLTDKTGAGTSFKLTPSGSTYTHSVIYRFKGGSDGSGPFDTPGLVADRSGNLYGTTVYGGGSTACTDGCGTVFKLVRSGKRFAESVLYAFQGGTDGATPYGGVAIDRKGNLLGTTSSGGRSGVGTIFSIAP